MEISLLLAQKILSMFLMACVGFWATSTGRFDTRDTDALTRINLTIVCPCAIFYSFQMEFTMEKVTGLMTAMAAAVVVHICFIALERILRAPLRLRPAESATIIYSNSLNLIIPIVSATLSSDEVFYCSAFVLIQTFLLWTHGRMIISGEKTFQWKNMLNPNIVSIFLGFVLFLCRLQLPGILNTTVSGIASMVGPVSMMVMGMLIGTMDLKKIFSSGRIYGIAALRLLVFPLLMIPVLRYSGLMRIHPQAPSIYMVTMIAAASCSASSVPQICQVYGSDAEYAGFLNALTLTGCILTMPVVIFFYQLVL